MMLRRKREEGQRVIDAGVEDRHRFGQRIREARPKIGNRALRTLKRHLREGRLESGRSFRLCGTCARMFRKKCTLQRCQVAPLFGVTKSRSPERPLRVPTELGAAR